MFLHLAVTGDDLAKRPSSDFFALSSLQCHPKDGRLDTMNKELIATVSATIKAPVAAVWSAVTDPEKIKLYLYGTQTETDWQVGSTIRFTGEWEGTPYVD